MKNSFYKIQIFLLYIIAIFPLVKFDWSSKALILFCLVTITLALKAKKINFDLQKTKSFLLLSSYFLLFMVSFFYSSNKEESYRAIIQLSPLIIIPFIITFVDIKFDNYVKKTALNIFVFVNVMYSFFIIYLFISTIQIGDINWSYYLRDYDKFQFKINENLTQEYFLIHKPYFSAGFVISAIYCINLFFSTKTKYSYNSILYLVIFLYLSFWIFYAFSFPNVIALIVSFLLLVYIKMNKKYFLSLLTLVVFSSLFIVSLKTKEVDVERGFNFIKSSITDNEYEINDSRQEIYKTYKSILQNSSLTDFLIGFGVGDVQDELNKNYVKRLNTNIPKNLLFFSEEFNNAYWFKNNIKIFSNQIKSPETTLNADLLFINDSNLIGSHNISTKTIFEKKGIYTFSVYAKKNESSNLILRLGAINQLAVFNLETGAITHKLDVVDAGIFKLSNNWFRCFISVNLTKEGLVLIGLSNFKGDYNFSNKKSMSVYLWGAQFEKGSLSDYKKRGKELLKYALDKKLNTHNNFLYFLMSTGLIGLILFVISLGSLFYESILNFDILKLSFCIILILNFLTENFLSRHWGLMFFSLMLLVLFSNQEKRQKKL